MAQAEDQELKNHYDILPWLAVLRIGDSICGGYEKGVQQLLTDKAEVVHWVELLKSK